MRAPPFRPEKVVILGAGVMGAGIACAFAQAGVEVVLKRRSSSAPGPNPVADLVQSAVRTGRTTREQADELLARITTTASFGEAGAAELVIETVIEDATAKAQVLAEIEPHVAADALLASNTSTLAITGLAKHVTRPAEFVGLHFFSPVAKMPLLEIVRGNETSDATVRRAVEVASLIEKTPIVVNDSRGFFTTRILGTFINEGIAMLLEGVPAPVLEHAATQAGYPARVLQLADELGLDLLRKLHVAAKDPRVARSSGWGTHPSEQVIGRMLDELDRPGRRAGRGFYDYRDGRRAGLWDGLRTAFAPAGQGSEVPVKDLSERMLVLEALEAVRCVDERVIESASDADLGSILGTGYPAWTGGVLSYIDSYSGGPAGFVTRARDLAGRFGERFQPPVSLVQRAERGSQEGGYPSWMTSRRG